MPKKEYIVKIGNLFEVQGVSKDLLEALMQRGMDKAHAAFWILRQSIILGGGEVKYNPQRRQLEKALKGGEG